MTDGFKTTSWRTALAAALLLGTSGAFVAGCEDEDPVEDELEEEIEELGEEAEEELEEEDDEMLDDEPMEEDDPLR